MCTFDSGHASGVVYLCCFVTLLQRIVHKHPICAGVPCVESVVWCRLPPAMSCWCACDVSNPFAPCAHDHRPEQQGSHSPSNCLCGWLAVGGLMLGATCWLCLAAHAHAVYGVLCTGSPMALPTSCGVLSIMHGPLMSIMSCCHVSQPNFASPLAWLEC